MTIFWIIIGVIVTGFIFVLGYYMGKKKWLIPVILSIIGIICFGFTIYCAIDINYYYNVEGGIFGVINGYLGVNDVEQEDLKFSLKYIELTQDYENQYSATITINDSISIEDKNYGVFVNGVPCTTSEVDKIHALADYTYIFYDNTMQEMLSDTLNFSFAFYENYSTLTITTQGGTEAVAKWNSYFNKNNFIVTIEEMPVISTELNETTGELTNEAVLTVEYYVDGLLYDTKIFDNNEVIEFPTTPTKTDTYVSNGVTYGYRFTHWQDSKLNEISADTLVTEDMQLYAVFETYEKPTMVNPL